MAEPARFDSPGGPQAFRSDPAIRGLGKVELCWQARMRVWALLGAHAIKGHGTREKLSQTQSWTGADAAIPGPGPGSLGRHSLLKRSELPWHLHRQGAARIRRLPCRAKWSSPTTARRTDRLRSPNPTERMWCTLNSADTAQPCAPASPRRAAASSSWATPTIAMTSSKFPASSQKWREGYDVVMGNRFTRRHQARRHALAPQILRQSGADGACSIYSFAPASATAIAACADFPARYSMPAGLPQHRNGVRLGIHHQGRPDRRAHHRDSRSSCGPTSAAARRICAVFAMAGVICDFFFSMLPIGCSCCRGALFFGGLALVLLAASRSAPSDRSNRAWIFTRMIFGVIFTLMGAQIISTWDFSPKCSATRNVLTAIPCRSKAHVASRAIWSTGSLAGADYFLAGLTGSAMVVWRWAASGFGPFNENAAGTVLVDVALPGVQVIFSSFFLSMLGISRDTYIGDYERDER